MSADEADPPPMVNGKKNGTEKFIPTNPKDMSICSKIDEVGILSFISFGWVFGYLWSIYRKKAEPCSSWQCSIFDSANVNTTRLEVMWKDECTRKPNNPSLFRVILSFMKYRLIGACFIFAMCLIFGFIGPTCFVRGLIAYVEDKPRDEDGSINYTDGFMIVGAILLVEISRVLLYGACWAVSYRTGIRVRGAVLTMMYKHLMNSRTMKNKTPAEIVNICANDGQRLFDAVTFAPLVLVGPFVLLGGLIYLLKVIGWPSLAGIGVFFVFDVVQAALGITMVRFRNRAIEKTEKRMNLMGEIIRSIRVIKMNVWENLFISRVIECRKDEQGCLRVAGYAQSLAIATGTIVPVVATIVTVLIVVAVGSDLKASDAFSSITVFFVMLFGIRMIPYGSRYLAEASQSIRKVQAMLTYPTYDQQIPLPRTHDVAVQMKNARFEWDQVEDSTLNDPKANAQGKDGGGEVAAHLLDSDNASTTFALSGLTMTVGKGELVGVCGSVGSGKTSFLHSILGQLSHESGEFAVSGSPALVSQVPCVFNATIRENILFGLPMNTQRYYKAIAASELSKDLESMSSNEQTEVGERGATLSGGQRARISLARALFSGKDIYLLDDIFSSIDKQVADKVFERAIKDFLCTKTVFLVTSNGEYLSKCDRIIYLKDGAMVAIDTHESLLKGSEDYKNFFEEFIQPNNGSRVSSPDVPASTSPDHQEAETCVQGDENNAKLSEEEEDFGLAGIDNRIYLEYIQAAGGWIMFSIVILAFFINVASGIFSTYWLSKWMNDVHKEIILDNGTVIHSTFADQPNVSYYTSVYTVSLFVLFFTGLFKAMIFVKVTLTAGSNLHSRMLNSVLFGKTSFFDSTPTGRILNRFSKDMDEIDVKLPFSAEALLQGMLICIGFLLMIGFVFPWFLLAVLPLFAVFYIFFICFRSGIRSLKRTENVTRSPLFSHVSTSLDDQVTIYSFAQTGRFVDGFKNKLDEHSGTMFMFQSAMRWQAVWLDLLVVAITVIVSFCIVVLSDSITPADAGMALAFALQMSGVFQFAVRSQTELESKLTAVERVSYYYKNIDPEDGLDCDTKPAESWPENGDIKFNNVVFRYRSDALPALDNVSFDINSTEKVGIVGRTGSGKSSICNTLFRLYPIESGEVTIAGVDTTSIPLKELRRAMAIIPQDPVIFVGTLRFNLDPQNEADDDAIWKSLELIGMKDTVQSFPDRLEHAIEANGKNLSSGQRQMICVCRALLRDVKIVVMDEATANLDSQSDKLIQQYVHARCTNRTLMLITHRLVNVAGMDKLLRVSKAKVKMEITNAPAKSVPLYPHLSPATTPTEEKKDLPGSKDTEENRSESAAVTAESEDNA